MSFTFKSSLHRHPEIATKIGLVVADYATLEMLMYLAYALASNKDPEECFTSFYGWRAINHRAQSVLSELKPRLDPMRYGAFDKAWKLMKGAARRRTEIAHCTFITKAERPMRLRLAKGKPVFEPIDLPLLERTLTQFHTLGQDLAILCVFCAGSQDRLGKILQKLPHARLSGNPLGDLASPPDLTPPPGFPLEESASRLGLDFAKL